jgi:hypothetical protein
MAEREPMILVPFFRWLTGATRRFSRSTALRAGILAIVFGAFVPAVHAAGIAVTSATIVPSEDGWQLDGEFDIQFSPRLEEAVNRGVPLYFVLEFEVARPRWWWFDEKPVKFSQTYKISYTPLLRQYRLSVGNVYQNFTRFEEVTRVLSRLRNVTIADRNTFKKDVTYQAGIRMRLDTAQLPKPFQLNAIASSDWTLASDWYRWSLTP